MMVFLQGFITRLQFRFDFCDCVFKTICDRYVPRPMFYWILSLGLFCHCFTCFDDDWKIPRIFFKIASKNINHFKTKLLNILNFFLFSRESVRGKTLPVNISTPLNTYENSSYRTAGIISSSKTYKCRPQQRRRSYRRRESYPGCCPPLWVWRPESGKPRPGFMCI